jgi:hypothetical protein
MPVVEPPPEENISFNKNVILSLFASFPCHQMQAACDNLQLGSYINAQSKIPHAPLKEGSCCQGSLKLVRFSDEQPRRLHWQCFDCFLSFTLRSQPQTRCTGPLFPTKCRGYNHSALVQVLSIAINDFVYSKYALHQVLVGLPAIPKSTFQDAIIAHKIVWPEIIDRGGAYGSCTQARLCQRRALHCDTLLRRW